jgi:peroxiredoxin
MFYPRALLPLPTRLLVLVVLITMTTACAPVAQPAARGEVKEGETVPDFTLVTPHGEAYQLSSLRGHPVILYFWTSWCTLCREGLLDLQAIYKRASSNGLVILAINHREDAKIVSDFGDELGLTYPLLADVDGRVGDLLGMTTIPTTYLINGQGSLVKVNPGVMTRIELETLAFGAIGSTALPPTTTALPTEPPEPTATASPPLEGCVMAGVLNVRAGPSTTAVVIKGLVKGDCVALDARNSDGSWLRLSETRPNGQRMWVAKIYVRVDGQVETLPISE